MTPMWLLLLACLHAILPAEAFVVDVVRSPSSSWRRAEDDVWREPSTNTLATTKKDTLQRYGYPPLSSVHLFGFGGGDDTTATTDKKTKQLGVFEQVGPAEKYNTLVEYVRLWSKRFEDNNQKLLTTPVKEVKIHDDLPEDGVDSCVYVRILFDEVETGYDDDEEEEEEADDKEDKQPKKRDKIKQGGVEILVEKLPNHSLRVRVRRCEMDDETVAKEMSEETIVKELKEALDVWKREQTQK